MNENIDKETREKARFIASAIWGALIGGTVVVLQITPEQLWNGITSAPANIVQFFSNLIGM